jgi:hypothetical protein
MRFRYHKCVKFYGTENPITPHNIYDIAPEYQKGVYSNSLRLITSEGVQGGKGIPVYMIRRYIQHLWNLSQGILLKHSEVGVRLVTDVRKKNRRL